MKEAEIFFRVDADPHVGLGHLRRCLALAEAFRDEGYVRIVFLTKNPSLVRSWAGRKFRVVSIQSEEFRYEPDEFRKLFVESKPRLLIVDHYGYTQKTLRQAKRFFENVVYIDDNGSWDEYPVDAVVNYHVYAPEISYPRRGTPKLFLGTRYAPISRDVVKERRRRREDRTLKLFISHGGVATLKSLGPILKTLPLLKKKIPNSRTALASGISLKLGELGSLPVELVSAGKAVERMGNSNMAISASGVTAYELACIGVPVLLFVTADNQERVAEAFERRGVAKQVGRIENLDPRRLMSEIVELWHDRKRRKRAAERGKRLVDGRGASRLAQSLSRVFLT